MGSADEIYIVLLEELLDHGLAKGIRDTTVILSPARLSLFGVRPDQVAEKTILGDLSGPRNLLKLRNSDELGAQAAVHAEDFVVDQSGDRHAVEYILELLPHADRVATLALVVKAVYAVDLSTLVVTAQKEKILLEFDLVCEKKDDGLQRVLASVNVVAQEQVVGFRREATILEKT